MTFQDTHEHEKVIFRAKGSDKWSIFVVPYASNFIFSTLLQRSSLEPAFQQKILPKRFRRTLPRSMPSVS